jgi:hypothetical protein
MQLVCPLHVHELALSTKVFQAGIFKEIHVSLLIVHVPMSDSVDAFGSGTKTHKDTDNFRH